MNKTFFILLFCGISGLVLSFSITGVSLAERKTDLPVCSYSYEGKSADDWCTGCSGSVHDFCVDSRHYHFGCSGLACNCDPATAWYEDCPYGCEGGACLAAPPARPVCSNLACQAPQSDCQCGYAVTTAAWPWCCAAIGGLFPTQAACQTACGGGGNGDGNGNGGNGGGGGGFSIEIENPLKAESFQELVDAIINFIFWAGITIAPIMFILAGFWFVTSMGDPERVRTARKIMLYTAIGLAIILLAKGLILVLKSILGVTS